MSPPSSAAGASNFVVSTPVIRSKLVKSSFREDTNPHIDRKSSSFSFERYLVKPSAMFASVRTCPTLIKPCCHASRNKSRRSRNITWAAIMAVLNPSYTIFKAVELSIKIVIGWYTSHVSFALETAGGPARSLSQSRYIPIVDRTNECTATISAHAEESAATFCFELPHAMSAKEAPPTKNEQEPLWLFGEIKLASECEMKFSLSPFLKR